MKTHLALLGFVLLGLFRPAGADDLDWLIGCWETTDKTAIEVWVKDNDTDLLGFGAVISQGQVVFHEVLSISRSADGTFTYTAHPDGQSKTSFTADSVAGKEVKFSNAAHDYPQEIVYRRDGEKLFATIALTGGDKAQAFNKKACE